MLAEADDAAGAVRVSVRPEWMDKQCTSCQATGWVKANRPGQKTCPQCHNKDTNAGKRKRKAEAHHYY